MNTRRRVRAEASPSSSRPSKRSRSNPSSRSHSRSSASNPNPNPSSPMDPTDKGKKQLPPSASSSRAEPDPNGGGGGGDAFFDRDFASASSALQGFRHRMGAGLDYLSVSGSSGAQIAARLKKILEDLRANGEEGKQVEALTQLCEILSIGTEGSLVGLTVESYVPVLVGLLNHRSNAEIMLLAARAITHLCDVLPSSCAVVVHHGAVTCFVERLLTIEYMDLAEQVRNGSATHKS